MNSMIDALLTLSKLSSQPLARQPVNLSQLAGYVAEDLRRQSPGARGRRCTSSPACRCIGDPTLLRLVLENLLGNAWKYTGKCRAPEVWLERRPDSSPDTFTVRDNGAGFDMRFADRLFGVFQRLHSASDFQGTGVGLATVRRIVRRHGGEIWAEAEVDRGASFHFTPAAAAERAAPPAHCAGLRQQFDRLQQALGLVGQRRAARWRPAAAAAPAPRRAAASSGASARPPPSPPAAPAPRCRWLRARLARPAPRRAAHRCCANAASTAGTIWRMSSGLTR